MKKSEGAVPPTGPLEASAPALPWRVGAWAGQPNYECARCPYRTLDRESIQAHVRTHA